MKDPQFEHTIRVNAGWAWEMKKGQIVRMSYQSIIDFVVFNTHNLYERIDQARSKGNQGKLHLTTGDLLISKTNNTMMTILEDNFNGTHDMQYGMCSEYGYSFRFNRRHLAPWKEIYAKAGITKREDLPLWGCYENIITALQNYPIMPIDVPSPFNIGQHMEFDPDGKIRWAVVEKHSQLFRPDTHIDLRAEMDLVCAASCDPGMGKLGSSNGYYAKPVHVAVYND